MTVDPGCSMLTTDVNIWVVRSGVGAVEVMVMAVSESGAWGSRLGRMMEASAATAKARARRVERCMLVSLILPQCRSRNVKTSQDVQREAYVYIGFVMVMAFASCYSIRVPNQHVHAKDPSSSVEVRRSTPYTASSLRDRYRTIA